MSRTAVGPEVLEPTALELVGPRRAATRRLLGAGHPASDRLETAPPAYLLVHATSDIARHCELVTPLPAIGEVRVVVTPARMAGEWHLDVASRDRSGLLAAFTGVFARAGLDVVQSVVATWPDGAALQAFIVRSAVPPFPAHLQTRLEVSLGQPLASSPLTDATVSFDDNASSLFTACEIRATNRAGLLHDIAVAFASAGIDIHAARVSTVGRTACDHFDLSDAGGHKLNEEAKKVFMSWLRTGSVGAADFTRRARAGNNLATRTGHSRG